MIWSTSDFLPPLCFAETNVRIGSESHQPVGEWKENMTSSGSRGACRVEVKRRQGENLWLRAKGCVHCTCFAYARNCGDSKSVHDEHSPNISSCFYPTVNQSLYSTCVLFLLFSFCYLLPHKIIPAVSVLRDSSKSVHSSQSRNFNVAPSAILVFRGTTVFISPVKLWNNFLKKPNFCPSLIRLQSVDLTLLWVVYPRWLIKGIWCWLQVARSIIPKLSANSVQISLLVWILQNIHHILRNISRSLLAAPK